MNQFRSTRHRGHTTKIMGFPLFNFSRFGRGIEMRGYDADHLSCPSAMGNRKQRIGVDTLALRPLAPLALHRLRGVNQNSIQIKKNG